MEAARARLAGLGLQGAVTFHPWIEGLCTPVGMDRDEGVGAQSRGDGRRQKDGLPASRLDESFQGARHVRD